jgi:ribose/xylose/arabinose/galactoside ABC-type transport system permease subunit
LIIAITATVAWCDLHFLSHENMRDILVRAAPTAIIACGVMLVVIAREIDISVGSLTAWLAALFGIAISRDHLHWPLAAGVPLVLFLGALMGWTTGAVVTFGRVPSIMVTLGMLTALRGLTTLIMHGENIAGLPDDLSRWAKQGWGGIPLSVWTACVVVAVTAWIMHFTATGRQLFAIGSSPRAAVIAGLRVGRLKRFVFAYTGFLTAVATIVDVPRLPKIEAGIGSELELLVITCVVVGGVSISGGRGTLTGVLLAVLLMTMVRPVLTFVALGESGEKWTKAIQGAFILCAVVADKTLAGRQAHRGRVE